MKPSAKWILSSALLPLHINFKSEVEEADLDTGLDSKDFADVVVVVVVAIVVLLVGLAYKNP